MVYIVIITILFNVSVYLLVVCIPEIHMVSVLVIWLYNKADNMLFDTSNTE